METTPSSTRSDSPMDVSGNSPDDNVTRSTALPEIERWQALYSMANTDRMLEQRWQEDASLLFRKLGEPKSTQSGTKTEEKDAIDQIKKDLTTLLDHEEFVKRMEAEVLATDWMFPSPTKSTNNNK